MKAVRPAPMRKAKVVASGRVQGTKSADPAAASVETPSNHMTIVSEESVFCKTRTQV